MSETGTARRYDVVVVGGGVSGLSAAYRLRELAGDKPPALLLLESSARIGGQVRSRCEDGVLLEGGPESMLVQKPAGVALCKRLGFDSELIHPNPDRPALQVLHAGSLQHLPLGFRLIAPTKLLPLLTSPLFSWGGKARIALEPWVPARRDGGDESLASFVTRRFGSEVLERVAEPIIGGLFTADADQLSLQMTMPQFPELERRHGSVTRGLRRMARAPTGASTGSAFVALKDGMRSLVDRLAARLPDGSVRTSAPIEGARFDESGGVWRLRVSGQGEVTAAAMILACPAFAAAEILKEVDAPLSSDLANLVYASCVTVNLVYRSDAIRRPLQSFGFFVPRVEASPILACSYVSEKFAGRVPQGRALLRVFLGGALHPRVVEREDRALVELSHHRLRSLLEIAEAPQLATVHRFPRSMPQFPVGDRQRIDRIERAAERLPGLHLCGGSLGTVGLPDCIASGERAPESAWRVAQERSRSLELAI